MIVVQGSGVGGRWTVATQAIRAPFEGVGNEAGRAWACRWLRWSWRRALRLRRSGDEQRKRDERADDATSSGGKVAKHADPLGGTLLRGTTT
jgi:hypothetical protein